MGASVGDADGVEVGAREGVVVGVEVGTEVVSAHEWPTNGALQPATQLNPPCLANAVIYITASTNQGGGGPCVSGFLRTFLQKLIFLSDQEVPGRHKNIYRELRPSFTTSEIFGNICCLFRQQTQHLLTS